MTKIPLRNKDIDFNPIKNQSKLFDMDSSEASFSEEDKFIDNNSPFEYYDNQTEEPFPNYETEEIFEEMESEDSDIFSGSNTRYESLDAESIDLEIDPDIPYFFVFGNSTAGKSAMLSGLLFYIKTSGIGLLNSISEFDKRNHRKGDATLNNMVKKVRRGEFIEGTQTLDPTSFVFPTEINLEFQPKDGASCMPFCLLEMAGENLRDIELSEDGSSGGEFDRRIKAYLEHPDCNMIFICVVDVDDPETSEDLIDSFLTYVQKIGRRENPVLITVNKWDKVKDSYNSAEDYIKKNMVILSSRLRSESRPMYYMSYSIGEVSSEGTKDKFKYNPHDSQKLFNWMYETSTGVSLMQKPKKSILDRISNTIKNIFSGE